MQEIRNNNKTNLKEFICMDKKEGFLYTYTEPAILAQYIKEIFEMTISYDIV